MTSEDQIILSPILLPKPTKRLPLLIQDPSRRLQEPVMNVPAAQHLLTQLVVEKDLVVALLGQVQSPDREHDLAVVVVEVDDVRRRPSLGLLVGHSFDDPVRVQVELSDRRGDFGVSEIGLVDGEDDAADSWDGLELFGCCCCPRGAVVGPHVCAAFPCPPAESHAEYAFQSTSY